MIPLHPVVRFRINGVVFTRVFATSTVDVCHELAEDVLEKLSIADIWRCESYRCRASIEVRCPCGRGRWASERGDPYGEQYGARQLSQGAR